jgi:hypothetical protein
MDLRLTIHDLRLAVRHGLTRVRGTPAVLRFLLPVFCLVLFAGCDQLAAVLPASARRSEEKKPEARSRPSQERAAQRPPTAGSTPAGFVPAKISLLPLCELSGSSGGGSSATLSVYVTLPDAFGSPLKVPGVLRFELYEYVPRSAEARGQRIAIWPDLDLTDPTENNRYWRDFLRAYEFDLEVRADGNKTYILEATYLSPDGKRLSAEHLLRGPAPTSTK